MPFSSLNKTLLLTASFSAMLFISGCGDGPQKKQNDGPQKKQNTLSFEGMKEVSVSSVTKKAYLTLVYNGYSANSSDYTLPENLISDLSATELSNLYLFSIYQDELQNKVSKDHAITLPSGYRINTGDTVLPPSVSLGKNKAESVKQYKNKATPSAGNPVLVSMPSASKLVPETPFVLSNSSYTGVLFDKMDVSVSNKPTILSIERHDVQAPSFGAFAHYKGLAPEIRFYDATSAIDKTVNDMPLLTTSKAGTIKARYVYLNTTLGSEAEGMNITSLSASQFAALGMSSEDLLTLFSGPFEGTLLEVTQRAADKKKTPETVALYYDTSMGVIALGGNSTFGNVALTDKAYLYPVSSKDTVVRSVYADATSGIITETGKKITIDKLQTQGSLRLMTVFTEDKKTEMVHIKDLQGTTKFILEFGRVKSGIDLSKLSNIALLRHDGVAIPGATVVDVDAHVGGVLYDLTGKYENNQVILKSAAKKTLAMASGAVEKALAHAPSAQGITGAEYAELTSKLSPGNHLHKGHTQNIAAAQMSHLSMSLLGVNTQLSQSSSQLDNGLRVSSSALAHHTTISASFSKGMGIISAYGVSDSSGDNTSVGMNATLSSTLLFPGLEIAPAFSLGYAVDGLSDAVLQAKNTTFKLSNMGVSSVYAQLAVAATNVSMGELKLSGVIGADARYSYFNKGELVAEHERFSLKGESPAAFSTFLEASATTGTASFVARVVNGNSFELNFYITN